MSAATASITRSITLPNALVRDTGLQLAGSNDEPFL